MRGKYDQKTQLLKIAKLNLKVIFVGLLCFSFSSTAKNGVLGYAKIKTNHSGANIANYYKFIFLHKLKETFQGMSSNYAENKLLHRIGIPARVIFTPSPCQD